MSDFFSGPAMAPLRRRWPVTRLGKWTAWAFLVTIVCWPLQYISGNAGDSFGLVWLLALLVFFATGIPLLFRWLRRNLLWSLRNRLLVNYLLIGLAPIVLLTILFGLISYLLAGQFAIFAATDELDRQVNEMSTEAQEIAVHAAHMPDAAWAAGKISIPEAEAVPGSPVDADRTLNIFRDGKPVALTAGDRVADNSITGVPAWTHGRFTGITNDHDRPFARNVSERIANGHTIDVVSSEPINASILARAAEGLGRATLMKGAVSLSDSKSHEHTSFNFSDRKGAHVAINGQDVTGQDEKGLKDKSENNDDLSDPDIKISGLSGGTLPGKASWYDINVTFLTPLALRDWQAGDALTTTLSVSSRPSLLYHRLFASSVRFGGLIRAALLTIAIIFAVIELLALLMASTLSRKITRSIAELYEGTRRVDSGDLTHQIPVRQRDQLGELGTSFNSMTYSLQRLMAEQKEKERLQNELSIAQEVQANLFPQSGVVMGGLDVHGVCRPARTVSGDYYDFLIFSPTSLGLALGDISGKGISAALLMASLHSAVRAYRVAAEEIGLAEDRMRVSSGLGNDFHPDWAGMFEAPGKLLELLNRHLYLSTQPSKYATLWLGSYDGGSGRLTYSNGGQLPPLVLCTTGEVKRLDKGGTVVGLMDGATYDQGSVELAEGDIVIAYSDGVTEPENEYGDFGEDRLVEIVRQHRTAPLDVISGHVMAALTDWIGAEEQPDDITLVLARQS